MHVISVYTLCVPPNCLYSVLNCLRTEPIAADRPHNPQRNRGICHVSFSDHTLNIFKNTHCLLGEWDLDRDFVLDFDRLALLLLLLLLLSFLMLDQNKRKCCINYVACNHRQYKMNCIVQHLAIFYKTWLLTHCMGS